MMEYRREIDGLRAVAVLPVVFFHAGFTLFSGGYVGVDIFFVISGYLITSILIKDLESGKFSIAKFYERRARRILPALFFVILCCIPFAYVWMIPQQFKDFSQAIVSVLLFASNVLFWKKEHYFAPSAEENPLLHTWSLAVEEQFYIFFPILLFVLWRFGKQPVFYVVLGLSCVSLLLSEWGWRNYSSANFYLLPTRAWELGIGAMCALYLHNHVVKMSQSFPILGLALILYSIFMFDESIPFPSFYTLMPVLGTSLIILFCSRGTLVYKLLSLKYVVWIGLLSYSIYLWHQPLMAFARIKFYSHLNWATMLSLCITSIILAYFTWRYIERPFRVKDGSWINTRVKVFSTAIIASFAMFSFGLYGHISNGMPERINLSKEKIPYIETAIESPMRNQCHASPGNIIEPEDACRYNNKRASIAVFGDSHVVELAYALGEQVKEDDVGVAHFSFSGCGPSFGKNDDSPCTEWTENTIDYIIDNNDFTHVVVSYNLAPLIWGNVQETYPNLPSNTISERGISVTDSLRSMLIAIAGSGKKVIFVDQYPELPRRIHILLYLESLKDGNVLGLPRSWWNVFKDFFENTQSIPEPVNQVNVDDIFCDKDVCYGGKDGVSFYFDDDHLSVEGARKVADRIINEANFNGGDY